MIIRLLALQFFSLLSPVSACLANEYPPFRNRCYTSQSGHIYALVELLDGPEFYSSYGPCNVTIYSVPNEEAARGSLVSGIKDSPQGIYAISDDWLKTTEPLRDIKISNLRLNRPPANLCVSGNGLGFALIDWYGPNRGLETGKLKAVTILDYRSHVIHEYSLKEIWRDDAHRFETISDNVFWHHDSWIDETIGELIVVGVPASATGLTFVVRSINLVDGKIKPDAENSVVRALSMPNSDGFQTAVEYATIFPSEKTTKQLNFTFSQLDEGCIEKEFVKYALAKIDGRINTKQINRLRKMCTNVSDELDSHESDKTYVKDKFAPDKIEWFLNRFEE